MIPNLEINSKKHKPPEEVKDDNTRLKKHIKIVKFAQGMTKLPKKRKHVDPTKNSSILGLDDSVLRIYG